jgi:hypothetical protein
MVAQYLHPPRHHLRLQVVHLQVVPHIQAVDLQRRSLLAHNQVEFLLSPQDIYILDQKLAHSDHMEEVAEAVVEAVVAKVVYIPHQLM